MNLTAFIMSIVGLLGAAVIVVLGFAIKRQIDLNNSNDSSPNPNPVGPNATPVGPKPSPNATPVGPKPSPNATPVGPKPSPNATPVGPKPSPSPTPVGPKPGPPPTPVGPKPGPSPTPVGPKPTPAVPVAPPPGYIGDFLTATNEAYSKCDASMNACNPPESDPNKTLPDGTDYVHQCNFQSLGTSAMRDAAAVLNNRVNSDVQYNFGIVGHDANSLFGEDAGTACCNAYEISFPPYIKGGWKDYRCPIWGGSNLIVQNFNSAAGGSDNFDVYMPGGGFGAFNACYNYPEFSNTTKFDSFMYTEYPTQGQPGDGGIRGGKDTDGAAAAWPKISEATAKEYCSSFTAVNGEGGSSGDWYDACMWVWENNYHYNGVGVAVRRINPPKELQYVTGCSKETTEWPNIEDIASTSNPWTITDESTGAYELSNDNGWEGNNDNSGFGNGGGQLTTTTMQDCCQGSCLRESNVGLADGESFSNPDNTVFYGCTKTNEIISGFPSGISTCNDFYK